MNWTILGNRSRRTRAKPRARDPTAPSATWPKIATVIGSVTTIRASSERRRKSPLPRPKMTVDPDTIIRLQ